MVGFPGLQPGNFTVMLSFPLQVLRFSRLHQMLISFCIYGATPKCHWKSFFLPSFEVISSLYSASAINHCPLTSLRGGYVICLMKTMERKIRGVAQIEVEGSKICDHECFNQVQQSSIHSINQRILTTGQMSGTLLGVEV